MSVINNPLLLGQEGGAGYSISRSVRLNSADSAYFSKTFGSGTQTKWTWAGWVKRSKIDSGTSVYGLFGAYSVSTNYGYIAFYQDGLRISDRPTAGSNATLQTTQVFRDPSAWYHIVVAWDGGNSTSTDRVRVFVNGVRVTAFSTATYPSTSSSVINSAIGHSLGRDESNTGYFDGYLADVWFLDNAVPTTTTRTVNGVTETILSDFGEFDATTGVWNPKAYTGSVSGNSFHLDFANNSNNTATTLGKDTSGNGNNFTPNNLSVTAGAGNDSVVDSPTNGTASSGGDAGGTVVGNYATLNPLDKGSSVTLTNGNLDVSTTSTWNSVRATFGIASGKWYWEYTMTAAGYTMVGIGTTAVSLTGYIGQSSGGYAYYSLNGNKWNSGTAAAYGNSFTTNDVIGVAFDADSGKIWFSKNGTWQASGDPAAGTNAAYSSISSATYFPTISQDNSLPATTGGSLNAGSRPFAFTCPSGFKSLNTANLPTPTILAGNTAFDTVLWTGNDTGQTITLPGGFSPDLIWTKMRSAANNHWLFDIIRGVNQGLSSSSTTNELTRSSSVTTFGSTGFTLGTSADVNSSSYTYAAWCWDAGSLTVTNTQGSITSTVRANASAGFSVVTWTQGSAGANTIGHGLGVAPQLVIVKSRSLASEWAVYHASLGATKFLKLNTTDAVGTVSAYWNDTSPTSTVFSVGSWSNLAGNNLAYCFAPVAGYSSFGSYTGNGSADGPFVYTWFRPRFLIYKRTDAADTFGWIMIDAARDSYNVATKYLGANVSTAEGTTNVVDFLSNGFKLRVPGADGNVSSGTYIYAAFAENPFSIARAR